MTQPVERTFVIADQSNQPQSTNRRLLPHITALWLILLSFTWLVDVNRAVYDADDGALLAQVQILAETGSWWAENPGAHIDPDGSFLGVAHARVRDGEVLAFPARPTMTLAMTAAWKFGGIRAATLVGITGVTVAAWSVAQLAGLVDPRSRILALWITGLGSPLAFQGLTLQGHGIAAGFAGLALWAVWRVRGAQAPSTLLLASSAMACMAIAGTIRREAVLFGVAIVLAGLVSWIRERDRRFALISLAPLVGAIAGVLFEHLLVTRVFDFAGRSLPTSTVHTSLLGDRLLSTARFVLPGQFPDPELPMYLAFGGALICVVAAVRFVRVGNERELITLMGLGAALLVVRLVLEPTPMIHGFVPAFPLALVMLTLATRLVSWSDALGLFVVFVSLVVLTTLTQYPSGGGFEWGSRYLSFAILALVPIGAPALVRLWQGLKNDRLQRPALMVFIVLALIPTAMALIAQHHARAVNHGNIEAGSTLAESLNTDVVVSTRPEITRVNSEHLTHGMAWFHAWNRELGELLSLLEQQGYDQVPLFVRDVQETESALEGSGWELENIQIRPENPGTVALGTLTRTDTRRNR